MHVSAVLNAHIHFPTYSWLKQEIIVFLPVYNSVTESTKKLLNISLFFRHSIVLHNDGAGYLWLRFSVVIRK